MILLTIHLILVGVVFILGGLGFKLSLVPFHTWAPDVYEGSNAALAGYMSVVPKIAAFIVALRFFEIFISVENRWVELILYVMVVLTMTIPNMAASCTKRCEKNVSIFFYITCRFCDGSYFSRYFSSN